MTRNNKFHVIHVVSRGGDRFSQNGKVEARKIYIHRKLGIFIFPIVLFR